MSVELLKLGLGLGEGIAQRTNQEKKSGALRWRGKIEKLKKKERKKKKIDGKLVRRNSGVPTHRWSSLSAGKSGFIIEWVTFIIENLLFQKFSLSWTRVFCFDTVCFGNLLFIQEVVGPLMTADHIFNAMCRKAMPNLMVSRSGQEILPRGSRSIPNGTETVMVDILHRLQGCPPRIFQTVRRWRGT